MKTKIDGISVECGPFKGRARSFSLVAETLTVVVIVVAIVIVALGCWRAG